MICDYWKNVDYGYEAYRNYAIRRNALTNRMHVERLRCSTWVVDVPSDKSWCWARQFIDGLQNPNHYWFDGTSTGLAMRAVDKGRIDSLIAMVQGDRRDALIMDRLVGTPDAKRVAQSLATVNARLDKELKS